MIQKYARLLRDQDQVEHFLSEVLDFDYTKLNDITYEIIKGEQGLVNADINSQTLNTTKFRDRNYKDDKTRWKLRTQVINELLYNMRPDDEDMICLGMGGALPNSGVISNKQAYILIGLPASGKSSIANHISEKFQAIILDSDFAKRKLPEFNKYECGATIVHEESSQIVFGFRDNPGNLLSVYEMALSKGYNMVIPKIGQNAQSILSLAKTLTTELKYNVHLTLISLLKRDATIRAINRFHKTKRYVPLGLIFDGYGNDPCLTYYLLKNRQPSTFESFGAISTNVEMGESPFSIDVAGNNPAKFYPYRENILI